MNRNELKQLAEKTVEISRNQFYFVNNKKISFSTVNDFNIYHEIVMLKNHKRRDKPATILVKNESTIDAIHRIGDNSLGVLNFASAKHPGGGFVVGAMAQEECLAYCSDLYIRQCEFGGKFYEKHNQQNNPLYTHTMFIDNATFFRDSNFHLIEKPTQCKVLTSAAVNAGVALQRGKNRPECNNIMKTRMKKILNVFIENNCANVVLGAFGCGVFGNSAEDVARIWKELLYTEGFIWYFDTICFSVLDTRSSNNFEIFRNIFTQ